MKGGGGQSKTQNPKNIVDWFPGVRLGIFTDRDQQSIFWGLEFENLFFQVRCCILGVLKINAVLFVVLHFQQYFLCPVFSPGTFIEAVLYYYNIMLNCC